MHLTSLRPPTDKKDGISTTLVPHCGPSDSFGSFDPPDSFDSVAYMDLDTNANTSPNIVEPDAVCGSVSIDATSASTFFKSLGTYLKTMFKCLYLSYKGWAHDKWKLAALKTNRRWLYISLSILFLVLFIVVIAVIVSAATSSTSSIEAELAEVKQKEQIQAAETRAHVQAELVPLVPTSAYAPAAPYRGDEVPGSSTTTQPRTFDYGASSSYTSSSPGWSYPTAGSFGM